jgi:riboflavin synthase
MFTGIIEEVGTIAAIERQGDAARLRINCTRVLGDAVVGSSIAVNGTCVTAVDLSSTGFAADLSPETLARTNLGSLRSGALVNLERPLRFNGRLDGHFVLGHVDGTGQITALEDLGKDNWSLGILIPMQLARFVVEKASVAVDGISLTVAAIAGNQLSFAIIPHTFENTNLRGRSPGEVVNIEADILAKHVEKLLAR